MPEQEQKPITIRFAGKEMDAHEFVRRARAKAVDWMNYQDLRGDERRDFLNSFQTTLQGIVDGTIPVSEFGKIEGLDDTDYKYIQSTGERTDVDGGFLRKARIGFDPNLNVETYLNGIADSMGQVKEPATAGKKKWNRFTAADRINGAIFGAYIPSSVDDLTDNEQLQRWADRFDPIGNNGIRTTGGRQAFIKNQLLSYRDDLLNDKYDISPEDKNNELNFLNQFTGDTQINEFELGKMFPWMSHLLFTDSKYMNQQARQQQTSQDALTGFLYGNGPVPYDPVLNPQEYQTAITLKNQVLERNWTNEFNNYNIKSTLQGESTYINNSKASVEKLKQYQQNLLQITDVDEFMNLQRSYSTEDANLNLYLYFSGIGQSVNNNDSYYADWKNGNLFKIHKNSDKEISVSITPLSQEIKTKDAALKSYLYNSYKEYKNYVPLEKKGGVLMAEDGSKTRKPKTTTTTTTTTTQPSTDVQTGTDDGTLGEGEFDEGVLGEETANTDNPDLTIPQTQDTGNPNDKTYSQNPYNRAQTLLDMYKNGLAKSLNNNIYNVMSGITAFHANPFHEHYKQYTSKPLEDDIARNNATYNQMGANAAAGTADQGAANAYQLAYRKQANAANQPLIMKQADDTRASIDKELEVARKNDFNRHEVGEKNRQADVALYNTKLHMKAELLNKNGNIDLKQIQGMQLGLAEAAESNYAREAKWDIYNDPKVSAARTEYEDLKARKLSGDWDPTKDEPLLTQAAIAYQQAKEDAALRYDAEHIAPSANGIPYVPGGYIRTLQRSFFRRGGSLDKLPLKERYMRMFNEMIRQSTEHQNKVHRDAYNYYRKLFMQSV